MSFSWRPARRHEPSAALAARDAAMKFSWQLTRRLCPVALGQFEPEHAHVEIEHTFKVRDLQMHVTNVNSRINWFACRHCATSTSEEPERQPTRCR